MNGNSLRAIACAAALASCAAPTLDQAGLPPATAFACPADGLVTVIKRVDGTNYRTTWLGPDPTDAMLCRSQFGNKPPFGRFLGRWNYENQSHVASLEEMTGARKEAVALLSGQTQQAGFILRGRTGEQLAHHWRLVGGETLDIDGKPVRTLRIHEYRVYGGNGAGMNTELWYAPDHKLFVRSVSDERALNWAVIRIRPPRTGPEE